MLSQPLRTKQLLAIVAAVVFTFPPAGCIAQPANRPNFVVILADDLGWADVAFHGSKNRTPNLDRLAATGVELCQQYVCPMCTPTRVALLTGRYPSRFGVTGAQNERALPWQTPTLATVLRGAGYDTALCGKWHLGSDPDWGPQKFGFDHSYGSLAGGCGPFDHRYKLGKHTRTWHRNGKLVDENGHVTDLIAKEAIDWLKAPERGKRPFFLYVPFTAVHIPIEEPKSWVDMYAHIESPSRRQHAASVSHLDDAVGKIESTLIQIGARDNTMLLFFSDNGAPPNAKNDDRNYPNGENYPAGPAGGSNLPLRGQKTQLYEGGIRVPALVHWPGGQWQSPKCHQVLHAVDWLPTLCSLIGIEPEPSWRLDGVNLAAQLAGKAPRIQRTLYWAGVGWRSAAVRVGDRKLVAINPNGAVLRSTELFDLAADPNETKNLASTFPDEVKSLLETMKQKAAQDKSSLP